MNLRTTTAALNVLVTALGVAAWAQTTPLGSLNALHIAALFGILAFSLMWVHYITGFLKDRVWPDQEPGIQYDVSRWAILVMFLAHPPLIYAGLAQLGLGAPPASVQKYVGDTGMVFLICGVVGIVAFLLFEAKKWLKAWGVWSWVVHANAVAMVLILIHGFGLGSITKTPWFLAVWSLYALTFLMVLTDTYRRKYRGQSVKLVAAMALCGLLAATAVAASMQQWTKAEVGLSAADKPRGNGDGDDSASDDEPEIAPGKLANQVGTGGAKCWVAINGTVYDATDNPSWVGGEHVQSGGRAKCGQDLTAVLSQSPHGDRVLSGLPIVGTLDE